MKKKGVLVLLSVALIGIVVVAWSWLTVRAASPAAETRSLPFYMGLPEKPVYSKSVVDSPRSSYVFDPVLQFDVVKHDFIVRNTSKSMLEFKKVYGCCGSLVEAFSPQIQPGQEGVIKIMLFTDRRGGEEIHGFIHAETNDPQRPEWTIEISCFVKKFADVSAHTIMLNGPWRSNLEGSSVVMTVPEYPFRITSLKVKRGIFITYGYRNIIRNGRKGYVIWAKNTRKEQGVIRDTIYVETDNPARPEFKIRVQGKLTG